MRTYSEFACVVERVTSRYGKIDKRIKRQANCASWPRVEFLGASTATQFGSAWSRITTIAIHCPGGRPPRPISRPRWTTPHLQVSRHPGPFFLHHRWRNTLLCAPFDGRSPSLTVKRATSSCSARCRSREQRMFNRWPTMPSSNTSVPNRATLGTTLRRSRRTRRRGMLARRATLPGAWVGE